MRLVEVGYARQQRPKGCREIQAWNRVVSRGMERNRWNLDIL
jgi:hypothetical protein